MPGPVCLEEVINGSNKPQSTCIGIAHSPDSVAPLVRNNDLVLVNDNLQVSPNLKCFAYTMAMRLLELPMILFLPKWLFLVWRLEERMRLGLVLEKSAIWTQR